MDEGGLLLTGGAVIGPEGHIHEDLSDIVIDTSLPSGAKPRSAASQYNIPIEGPGYMYHIFLSEDGILYWIGDLPYSWSKLTPDFVRLP